MNRVFIQFNKLFVSIVTIISSIPGTNSLIGAILYIISAILRLHLALFINFNYFLYGYKEVQVPINNKYPVFYVHGFIGDSNIYILGLGAYLDLNEIFEMPERHTINLSCSPIASNRIRGEQIWTGIRQWYITNKIPLDNDHPFILVGHSQGAQTCQYLVTEILPHMRSNKPYRNTANTSAKSDDKLVRSIITINGACKGSALVDIFYKNGNIINNYYSKVLIWLICLYAFVCEEFPSIKYYIYDLLLDPAIFTSDFYASILELGWSQEQLTQFSKVNKYLPFIDFSLMPEQAKTYLKNNHIRYLHASGNCTVKFGRFLYPEINLFPLWIPTYFYNLLVAGEPNDGIITFNASSNFYVNTDTKLTNVIVEDETVNASFVATYVTDPITNVNIKSIQDLHKLAISDDLIHTYHIDKIDHVPTLSWFLPWNYKRVTRAFAGITSYIRYLH